MKKRLIACLRILLCSQLIALLTAFENLQTAAAGGAEFPPFQRYSKTGPIHSGRCYEKLFLSAAVFLLAFFLPACSEPESGQGIDELLSGEISSVRFTAEKLSFWDERLMLTRAVRTGDSLVLAGMDGELRHHFYRFEPASGKLSPVEGLAVSGVESIDGVSSGEAYILYTGEDSCRRIINIAADNSWSEAPLTLPDELAQDFFTMFFSLTALICSTTGARFFFWIPKERKPPPSALSTAR